MLRVERYDHLFLGPTLLFPLPPFLLRYSSPSLPLVLSILVSTNVHAQVQELLSTVQTRRDESDLSDDSPVLRMKNVSKRMSIRGSFSEPDRQVSSNAGGLLSSHPHPPQLKRLFRAVRDGDTNYVKYLFGWEEGTVDQCHPLCQCERCSQLRKVIMPRCACASEVYGSVFVCLCVCVDRYNCSRMN